MRTGCYVYRCFCTYVEFFTNSYFLGDENEEQGSYSINTAIVRPTILHCACILQLGPIIAATRKYLRRNFNNGKWVNGLIWCWSDLMRLDFEKSGWHGMTMANGKFSGIRYAIFGLRMRILPIAQTKLSWAGSHSVGSLLHGHTWIAEIPVKIRINDERGGNNGNDSNDYGAASRAHRRVGFNGCKCLKRSRVWNLLVSGCHANGYGVPLEKPVIWAFSISTTPNKTCHTFPYPTKWLVPSYRRTIKAVLASHTPIRSSSPLYPDKLRSMGGGPVANTGSSTGFAHLLDPNRKWYNNRRWVSSFLVKLRNWRLPCLGS